MLGRDREPRTRIRSQAQRCHGGLRGEAGAHHCTGTIYENGICYRDEICNLFAECRRQGDCGGDAASSYQRVREGTTAE